MHIYRIDATRLRSWFARARTNECYVAISEKMLTLSPAALTVAIANFTRLHGF